MGNAAPSFDASEVSWVSHASWADCRRLLPGHTWLGRDDPLWKAAVGDPWVVTADVSASWVGRGSQGQWRFDSFTVTRLAVFGPPSRAVPYTERLRSSGGRDLGLVVFPAGTLLRVVGRGGSWDAGCAWPSASSYLSFEVSGGLARLDLTTYRVMGTTRSGDAWSDEVSWSDIAVAAVIVPASHSFAHDPALVADAIARIDAARRSSAAPVT